MTRTPTKPLDDKAMWRRLIAKTHPDGGGDHELFIWTGALKTHVCALDGESEFETSRRDRWTPSEDRDRIPYPADTDFREATLKALRYASVHNNGYGRLLQLLEDCYAMSDMWREQERGASYKRLAAIGHKTGMNVAQRSRWYDIARSIPLSDRHAGHIISRLKSSEAA